MTAELVEQLLESEADVVTSGNHGWDGPGAGVVHGYPKVLRPLLRPHNFPEEVVGKGIVTLEIRD
jgi:calcineurin-like phosphoesterase